MKHDGKVLHGHWETSGDRGSHWKCSVKKLEENTCVEVFFY